MKNSLKKKHHLRDNLGDCLSLCVREEKQQYICASKCSLRICCLEIFLL
ncbi:rCG51331 [Rattus norvegicus]|uniref:RCG51331 n=1 Tax=Rattus norvegicus TaxID=10116 RepID=A6IY21_RAT|nr:rCG51331 [Rattus norvegicus]